VGSQGGGPGCRGTLLPASNFLPPVFVLEAKMSNFEHYFENETVRHGAWIALSAVTLATFFMTVFSW